MLRGNSLILICFLFVLFVQNGQTRNQPSNQLNQSQSKAKDEFYGDKNILARVECYNDIQKFCGNKLGSLKNDMFALLCLQDAVNRLNSDLQPACSQIVWEYKVNLTQTLNFVDKIKSFCTNEIAKDSDLEQCTFETRPGYALSCFIDNIRKISINSECYKNLYYIQIVAFSDFSLIAPFVEHCNQSITALNCGLLTKPSTYQKFIYPHSQGETLQCLNNKLSNVTNLSQQERDYIKNFPEKCFLQVNRLTELQSDDFHLDRPLFFACREDRERFCGSIQANDKRILNCLFDHKDHSEMSLECSKILSNHLSTLGRDYRLAHSLINYCNDEMKAYRCMPQVGFEKTLQFYLSWVLLCLEKGFKTQQLAEKKKENLPKILFSKNCQNEMISYRKLFTSNFKMMPEVVSSCSYEINLFCSENGELFSNTIHCLMEQARNRSNSNLLSNECKNAVNDALKLMDISSYYRVDKVLYESCRALIDGVCQTNAFSEINTLDCLMNNFDGPDMNDRCEQRLLEVQYFMARDWNLDSELYNYCHDEAIKRCSAVDNWHVQKTALNNQKKQVDPGPQVLACLYRAGYDEEDPLSKDCQIRVRRVLRSRASRVNLLPNIEENCLEVLSRYCLNNTKPSQEMECLQSNLNNYKHQYPQCYKEVFSFTELQAKDTRLNRDLSRACQPAIQAHCQKFGENELDFGAIIDCLINLKNRKLMNKECKIRLNHYQLISIRDYHFSYNFNKYCQHDINKYCSNFGDNKGEIIRCLSEILIDQQLFHNEKKLRKDCREQLKTAYLQQEQFDDKEHFKDVDIQFTKVCKADIKRLNCFDNENFENVIECLRVNFDSLDSNCKSIIFNHEQIEAIDNSFDNELQINCRYDINKYCSGQEGEKVLDCLSRTLSLLEKKCHKIVLERMIERTRDDRLNPGFFEACNTDAKKYCPEDYRKINDPRYAKEQLGGIIATCLRSKFAQFNNGIFLSPQCKNEISNMILNSEFDIKLDHELYKACRSIINLHCSTSILKSGGNFENVLECLKADFYTGQISDPYCARELARKTQETLVDIHLDPSLHEACSLDIQRICRDTPPGQSRIIMCLMEAMHIQKIVISAGCRKKLDERQRLWNIAHQKYQMLLPQNWNDFYQAITTHPERSYIFTILSVIFFVLLFIGCIFGRCSKRTYRELKNR